MKKKNKKENKLRVFFKNFGLLLRCILATASFAVLWVGITLAKSSHTGIWLLIVGILATLLCLLANIVIPLMKLNKN